MVTPGRRERDRPLDVPRDVAVALEPAEHLVHGGGGELHRAAQVGAGHREAGLEQPEQALQVLLFGGRSLVRHLELIVAGAWAGEKDARPRTPRQPNTGPTGTGALASPSIAAP